MGTSESGKNYADKGLLERVMAGGMHVCIVDPLGVWWGLRDGAGGASSEGVLERVTFARIRTRDTSPTPRRDLPVGRPGTLAPVDLAGIQAALASLVKDTSEGEAPAPPARTLASELAGRLQQRKVELAILRAHLTRMQVETVGMQMPRA